MYNEKIHDLLVVMDEQNQKKMPVSKTYFVSLRLSPCALKLGCNVLLSHYGRNVFIH